MCVCVRMCVYEREKERERRAKGVFSNPVKADVCVQKKRRKKKTTKSKLPFFCKGKTNLCSGFFVFVICICVFNFLSALLSEAGNEIFDTSFCFILLFFNVSFSTIRIKVYAVRGEVEQRTVRERGVAAIAVCGLDVPLVCALCVLQVCIPLQHKD